MRGYACAAALSLWVCAAGSAAAAEPPAARLMVRFEPALARPGDTVQVQITAQDVTGAPAELAAPLAVDADSGKVTAPESRGPGAYVALLTVPQRLPLSRSILVLARAGAISREAALPLAPGPAAVLHVDGPSQCPASAEVCRLDVTAEDEAGNGADEVPTGTAERGKVLPPSSAGGGRWVIGYRPAHVERDADDRILVDLGTLHAEHRIQIQAERLRFDLAPRVGLAREDSTDRLAAGGQALGERLLSSGWLVGVGLEGVWWTSSHKAAAGSHSDRSQIALGALVLAERRVTRRLLAGVSAGGGVAEVTNTDVVPGNSQKVSATGWVPTAWGAATLGYDTFVGTPFVEFRAQWVGDAHLVTTDSGPKTPLFIWLGYRLHVR